MTERQGPPILRRINPDGAPGSLASRAVRMAGVNNFPIPTNTLKEIGTECFGVNTSGKEQLSFNNGVLIPDTEQDSPDARYDTALTIGKALFPDPKQIGQAEYFARFLLLPETILQNSLKQYISRPIGAKQLSEIALAANVPTLTLLERLQYMRGEGMHFKDILIGFPAEPNETDKGFIFTNRGIKRDATVVSENIEEIQELLRTAASYNDPRAFGIFARRTEYNGSECIYNLTFSTGDYAKFSRGLGTEEILIRFRLNNRVPAPSSFFGEPIVIDLDSDRLTQRQSATV